MILKKMIQGKRSGKWAGFKPALFLFSNLTYLSMKDKKFFYLKGARKLKSLKHKVIQTKNFIEDKFLKMAAFAFLSVVPVLNGSCYAAVNTGSIIDKILDIVYQIFGYVGIVLTLWGVGQLILAFKNEDADSKSRAIMCIVAGAALIGIKPLATQIGLKSSLIK